MASTRNETGRHRAVRSFVRRSGRLTTSQQRAIETLWPVYGLAFTPEPLDLAQVFGRVAPRVLEIGFGNGETLVEQAAASPALDFLGVEVHEPGIGHCLIRAREARVTNLRLIRHDAIEVLERQVPPQSLSRINLYFPDPWPKKRHHKRRIVSPAFIELCAERLVPGGALCIATDWAGYAAHIDQVFMDRHRFCCVERRKHTGDRPLDRPMTKFERRGLRQGHEIVDWRFERLA